MPNIIDEINAKFGDGTMTVASDPSLDIAKVSTGVLSVDYLLKGGLPKGRTIELFGQAGVGKTTLAYYCIRSAQERGERCAFFDTERTFDKDYVRNLGIDIDVLDYNRQKSGNQVMNLAETLLSSGEYGVIVIDSIAALCPIKELESALESTGWMTAVAQLMSAGLRKLTRANDKTVLIFINQMRENLAAGMFGKKWITAGGKAMAFYASTRLELARTETIKKPRTVIDESKGKEITRDVPVGHRVIVRVDKNKTGGAKEGDQTTFLYNYDKSRIDDVESMLYVGRQMGLITLSGARKWALGDEEYSNKETLKKTLAKDSELYGRVERTIRERIEEARVVGRQAPEESQEQEGAKGRGKPGQRGRRKASAG